MNIISVIIYEFLFVINNISQHDCQTDEFVTYIWISLVILKPQLNRNTFVLHALLPCKQTLDMNIYICTHIAQTNKCTYMYKHSHGMLFIHISSLEINYTIFLCIIIFHINNNNNNRKRGKHLFSVYTGRVTKKTCKKRISTCLSDSFFTLLVLALLMFNNLFPCDKQIKIRINVGVVCMCQIWILF